ncbi:hypothetical protein CRENBAI_005420 [Crenichthys baileyi]|uniref:Uncharacterized protein n=1 Tax=Crenichthys baileyi TaxID=28760 RepID=A0AAV9QU51_9TELE
MDLADEHQASSMDLFTFLSREAEKTLRRSAGLSVPQSAYDGSRLAIPCPGTGPLRRRSPPAPLAAHFGPAVKPLPSSRRKKRRRGALPVVRLATYVRAAASKPASSSATALSARLPAPPPMPSALAPARCSEATPEELEERLRFFARQIKSFRKTSLLYFSPEQMQRIKQMEEDYETAVRLFYCRPPSPTPSHMGAAAAVEQPTRQVSRALLLLLSSPRQVSSLLQSFRRGPWVGCLHNQVLSTFWPDTPQPDPKSASTSSTRRRGRRKRGASAQFIKGLGDTSAPAHATEGPGDASAPAHATEGPGDASAPVHATEGPGDTSAPVHATEGLGDASASVHATESFVLILASEPRDKGFEEEAPPDPVSVPEWFKEQFVLVLASEPRDEDSQGAASASEGSPGSASASEGSPGSQPDYEAPGFRPPEFHRVPVAGRRGLHAFAADHPGLCVGGPGLNSVLAGDDLLVAPLNSVLAGDDLLVARLDSVPVGDDLLVARLNFVPAGDDLLVARLNFVPAGDDLLVARLNSVPVGDDLLVARLNSVPVGDDLLVARLNSVPAGDDLLVARLNSVPAGDDLQVNLSPCSTWFTLHKYTPVQLHWAETFFQIMLMSCL